MSNTKAVALKKHNFGDDTKVGYLLLAPWLFGFIFMYVIPAAMSIYYSFTDYNLLSAPNWVGLKNYITIFTTDKTFRKALVVTFSYVFIMVPLRLAFALFVATLLNKKHMGMGFIVFCITSRPSSAALSLFPWSGSRFSATRVFL